MRFALVSSLFVAGVAAAVPATAADGTPTFTKDVAPIFYKSCIECHRATMFAPMSLTRTKTRVRGCAQSSGASRSGRCRRGGRTCRTACSATIRV